MSDHARTYTASDPLPVRHLLSEAADQIDLLKRLVRKLATAWEVTDDNRLVLPIPDGHGQEYAWVTHVVSPELAALFKEVTA